MSDLNIIDKDAAPPQYPHATSQDYGSEWLGLVRTLGVLG